MDTIEDLKHDVKMLNKQKFKINVLKSACNVQLLHMAGYALFLRRG